MPGHVKPMFSKRHVSEKNIEKVTKSTPIPMLWWDQGGPKNRRAKWPDGLCVCRLAQTRVFGMLKKAIPETLLEACGKGTRLAYRGKFIKGGGIGGSGPVFV